VFSWQSSNYTIFIISAVVAIFISDRKMYGLSSMIGSGALDVVVRIASTLFLEKLAKSLTVQVDEEDAPVGAFSNALIFDYNAFESPELFLMAADRQGMYFSLKTKRRYLDCACHATWSDSNFSSR
jgi:hypothetical protein